MPRPRRCYVYSTEAQLVADIEAGIVSAHDADVLRAFNRRLAKLAKKEDDVERQEPGP